MSKSLLVGSVYAPTERNETWRDLQFRFLQKTLGDDFDHAVWLNRVPESLFPDSQLAGRHDGDQLDFTQEHANGLRGLVRYFLAHPDYDNYLILDSDAFPFKQNWLEKLLAWLKADERLPERHWAAAVRTENLDTFPHPCVVFVRGHFLRSLPDPLGYFDPGPHEYRNLAGYSFKDVGFLDRPPFVFQPLLRTNFWNPHPVLSAVYGGLFYHHGAGSRPLELRSVSLRQYDHHIPRYSHFDTEHSLWLEISKNPVLYLNQLAQRG